ncbi:hypothetical protein WJX72_006426 [[Myrmecia] bisecta]|uniref:Cyclic nucleotide-binding domain-containing protein n=1 Tax=[Myrmecia] bisecta TaxID=41462 RepID=A0AAW1QAN0_9CHLO
MSAKPTPRQTLHDAVSRGGSLGMAGRTLHKRNSMFNPVHVPVHMVNKAGVDGKKPDSARANAPSGAAAAATGGNIASIMQWAVKAGNGSGSVGNDAAADGPPPPAGLKARWGMATSKLLAKEAARKIKTAAKLKALQRTPQHMIINRMRLLMDRIRPPPNASPEDRPGSQNSTAPRPGPGGADAAEAAAAAAAGGAPQGPGAPAANAKRRGSSEARRGSSGTHLQGAANPAVAKLRAEPPARPGTPVADQISAVEEMSVILCYLNPFLAKMAEDARMQLCNFVQYEEISREKVVYSQGDDPQKFYLILNGIVEVATRRLGHRSKTVKKKGETFAETCLLTGEPSTETITTYSKCIFLTVAKQDFLGVLEPYLLQEKRAIVDFLTGYVGVLEDAPRGLLTALAQHIQIQDHPADKDFELINEDCLYFIRAGTCNLLSAERHTVTEGASADAGDGISQHAMSQSGPLAKVELRDGRVIGTLGRVDQRTSRKVLVAARQLSVLEPGMYFGGGDLLLGEGDLQTALSVTAITPVQLYAISLAVFAKLATPELLQAMRDELCFEMTYFHGRAGLTAPDVVVGHPTALLAQKATEEAALQRKGKSKRRRGTRSSLTGGTAAAGKPADQPGDHGLGSRVAKAVRHYTSMQAHTSDETAGDARRKRVLGDKEDEDAAAVDAATTYHNGTAAERYWASPGSEPPKKQNMVSLLGQIFPEGIAPLAEKVERQERQDTVRREALVARASLPPMPGLDLLRHVSSLASVMDDIIKQTPRGTIISGATAPASGALAGQLLSAEISEFKTARKLAQAGGLAASGSGTIAPSSARSSEAGAAMRATGGPAKESIDGARPQPAASADQRAAPAPGDPPAVPSLKLGGLQPHSGRLGVALSDRTGLDASVGARLASSLQRYAMVPGVDAPRASHRKHYSAGEKLAAALIWEASSGRHPSPHLRQVMTYGEIRQKKQDSMRGDPVAIDQRELERLLAAFHPKKQ